MTPLLTRLFLLRDKLWPSQKFPLLLFFAVSAALCILPIFEAVRDSIGPKDYGTWYKIALAVRAHQPLYPANASESPYNFFYPPAIATLFYTPLSLAGPVGMVALLCLLSCAGHLASLLTSVYLAIGQVVTRRRLLYLLPWLVSLPFAWDIYFLGQLNMTLLAIMLLGFVGLERGKGEAAGVLFALCAAAKAFPFVIVFYLLWRRYYTATASMLVALALILVVLPAPFRGFDRNLQELGTWADHMLMHNTGGVLANQPDRGYHYGNQTLISVVNRLTRPLPVGRPKDGMMTVNLINVSSTTAFAIAIAIAAAMCAAFVAALPPKRLLTRDVLALEASAVLLMIVIFSPKAGSFYYCWTVPGVTAITAELLRSAPGIRRRLLLAGLGGGLFVMALALTQSFTRVPQGMGATMWGGMIIFAVLVVLLWEKKQGLRGAPGTIAAVPAPIEPALTR
jgi:hypothetical protein